MPASLSSRPHWPSYLDWSGDFNRLRLYGIYLASRIYPDQSLYSREFYSNAATFGLEPKQGTFALIRDAPRGTRSIFRQGKRYWKAGVMLNNLHGVAPVQMFPTRDPVRSAKLMGTIDSLDSRFRP